MSSPQRGDVYWVNLDPTIGAEIKKSRPCIIISPDGANKSGSLIIIVPITKAEGKKTFFHEVFIPKGTANLPYDSKIKAFQIRCIDKKRLCQPVVGSLSSDDVKMLDEKIRIVTGLY